MRQRATLLIVALVAACGRGAGAQSGAATLTRGAEVYREQRCQACHSIAGVGNRRYPLDGVGSRLSREQIRTWIVAPRQMNPTVRKKAHDKLPAGDLEALVTYLQSLRQP